QGGIVMRPGLRPIAAKNVAYRDAKIVGNDQTDTGDEQYLLPFQKWSPRPPNHQDRHHQSRPVLHFGRRVREPAKDFNRVDVMVVNEKRDGAINPKVTDHHCENTRACYDQAASQKIAILLTRRHSCGTSNWLIILNVS